MDNTIKLHETVNDTLKTKKTYRELYGDITACDYANDWLYIGCSLGFYYIFFLKQKSLNLQF